MLSMNQVTRWGKRGRGVDRSVWREMVVSTIYVTELVWGRGGGGGRLLPNWTQ